MNIVKIQFLINDKTLREKTLSLGVTTDLFML